MPDGAPLAAQLAGQPARAIFAGLPAGTVALSCGQAPELVATLRDGTGAAQNLTGSTGVVFNMRARGEAAKISRGACTVVDAATGQVKYVWAAGDTDTVGLFEGEFEATLAGGKVLSFPKPGYISIEITDDIA